jgi:hypothetical protein
MVEDGRVLFLAFSVLVVVVFYIYIHQAVAEVLHMKEWKEQNDEKSKNK